jgi:hypothetical protein
MNVQQIQWRTPHDIGAGLDEVAAIQPDLVFVFASTSYLEEPSALAAIRAAVPGATVVGCSTAGEICGQGVEDASCVVTAIRFERTPWRVVTEPLPAMGRSREVGISLGAQLASPELRCVIILAPGLEINGSALVDGLTEALGPNLPIVGGLAGDEGRFQQTWTVGPAGVRGDHVVAIGLYGDALQLGYGSFGGWLPFGPARKVTRCDNNLLFELDGEPALEVYKRYLGEYASGLPASGLLFPFAMLDGDQDESGLIRTILGVDEVTGSLTLAGEIFEGGYLKLMHASTDRLVSGAERAAMSAIRQDASPFQFALLVSCVGRKLIMGTRTEEEVEAVRDVFGESPVLAGFYSNGEICPFEPVVACRLHNQTMTVAAFGER